MQTLGSRPSQVIAGFGPAASPARYQVGPDVHQAITKEFGPAAAAEFLHPDDAKDRWLLNLWAANRCLLLEAGVPATQIHATDLPTGPLDHTGPTDPLDHPAPSDGYFFSDRAARPCGRLALVARLRGGQQPMDVTT